MPCPFCALLRASRGVVAAAVAVVLAVTSPVTAQHIGDILVESSGGVSSAGRLTTGAISEDGSGNPVVNHEVRAFAATFGLFPSYTDSPGFDSHGGGGLPLNILIGFNTLDHLRKWNGVDFSTVPAETLRINKGSTFVVTPTAAEPAFKPGFYFAQTNLSGARGDIHEHMGFFLQSPQSAGVYLWQAELYTNNASVGNSKPFFIVFNQNAQQAEADAALQYVSNVLLSPPCPGDLNADRVVNTADLTIFLSQFGGNVTPGTGGDLNSDGVVDTSDLVLFLSRFGGACP